MDLLERTHAADVAQAVRGAAEVAATHAAAAAHKAGDRATDLIDPILGGRNQSAGSRMLGQVRRHPWALAAAVAVLAALVVSMMKSRSGGLDIDDLAAEADSAGRFRSAA